MRQRLCVAAAVLIVTLGWMGVKIPSTLALGEAASRQGPTSIILIVTDDQRWDTLSTMPIVQRRLVTKGMKFSNAFVVNPLCCPSRASILTGLYSHSTKVYRQAPPYGRFEWFDDSSTFATWLDKAGYTTGFFGKYLDGYQNAALTGYVPPGWDRWAAFVHAAYYDYKLTMDGSVRTFGTEPKQYSTDVLADQATDFIRSNQGPLLVVFSPAAPHAPAIPAPRDADAVIPPRSEWPPSFNEADVSDKPAWVQTLPRLNEVDRSGIDRLRINQLRSLLAVDKATGELLNALRDTGRLSNSLIVYTSDNGLAWGEHRWTKKEVPYEESIRVPMIVRYDPLIENPGSTEALALNIDIAPTIAEAANLDVSDLTVDGRSLVPLLMEERARLRRSFLIEHLEGTNPVPTYCAVRTERYKYVRYRTGEFELYDLEEDPFELANIYGSDELPAGLLTRLKSRLKSLCDPPPPQVPPLSGQAGGDQGWGLVAGVSAAAAAAAAAMLAIRARRRRGPTS